jgi:hypothetical protein
VSPRPLHRKTAPVCSLPVSGHGIDVRQAGATYPVPRTLQKCAKSSVCAVWWPAHHGVLGAISIVGVSRALGRGESGYYSDRLITA